MHVSVDGCGAFWKSTAISYKFPRIIGPSNCFFLHHRPPQVFALNSSRASRGVLPLCFFQPDLRHVRQPLHTRTTRETKGKHLFISHFATFSIYSVHAWSSSILHKKGREREKWVVDGGVAAPLSSPSLCSIRSDPATVRPDTTSKVQSMKLSRVLDFL